VQMNFDGSFFSSLEEVICCKNLGGRLELFEFNVESKLLCRVDAPEGEIEPPEKNVLQHQS
jgi:hypothetical protein